MTEQSSRRASDAADIAELSGRLVPEAHVEHCYHRYETARRYAQGADVLEVAAGVGQGLGLLAHGARSVVATDYLFRNLEAARAQYGDRFPLVQLDAHRLPFADQTFNLILLFEAIYLLERPLEFLREARRVLREGGRVLIQSTNCAWRDFSPYRHATRYLDSRELASSLREAGFAVEMYAAFPTPQDRTASSLSLLRRLAWRLRVMPKPGPLKNLLRRLAYGRLVPYPAEVPVDAFGYASPVRIPDDARESSHIYLYAVGSPVTPSGRG